MTNEQYIEALTTATSDLIVETGEKMYKALREEDYELAAILRDRNQQIINEAAKAFSKVDKYPIEKFKQHFQNQVDFVYNELIKYYGPVI
jgi:excinuclease UvrABC nuclease subunit